MAVIDGGWIQNIPIKYIICCLIELYKEAVSPRNYFARSGPICRLDMNGIDSFIPILPTKEFLSVPLLPFMPDPLRNYPGVLTADLDLPRILYIMVKFKTLRGSFLANFPSQPCVTWMINVFPGAGPRDNAQPTSWKRIQNNVSDYENLKKKKIGETSWRSNGDDAISAASRGTFIEIRTASVHFRKEGGIFSNETKLIAI